MQKCDSGKGVQITRPPTGEAKNHNEVSTGEHSFDRRGPAIQAPPTLRSLATCLGFGLMSAARNCGGTPNLRMLSTKSRTAVMWIQPLNACTRG
jgi:hypothetical protein